MERDSISWLLYYTMDYVQWLTEVIGRGSGYVLFGFSCHCRMFGVLCNLCFLFFPTLASLLFIATLTEYHFLPHTPVTQVKFTTFPAVLAETQTSLPSIFETMLPEPIVSLTAFISISFTYLEPMHINLATAQNMETRIEDFDKFTTGCRSLLQHCGRPRYLESIWVLWTQL